MNMLKLCRVCRGNAYKVLSKFRCGTCKMSFTDYKAQGREVEVEEMEYLWMTWNKCRIYRQISTGYKKLDQLITQLFGRPHNEVHEFDYSWRKYSLIPGKVVMDDFIVLRTIDETQLLWNKEKAA